MAHLVQAVTLVILASGFLVYSGYSADILALEYLVIAAILAQLAQLALSGF